MTIQTIIEESKKLTKEQKQQLGYYFLFSTLNEDNRNNLMQFFQYSFNLPEIKIKEDLNQTIKTKPIFGILKGGIKFMASDFDDTLEDFNDYM